MKIIAKALGLAMVLVFISLAIYVSFRNIERTTELVKQNGNATKQEEPASEDYTTEEAEEDVLESDSISDFDDTIIYDEADDEDSAIKEVESESRYINTVDLLPSIFQERVTVSKDKVNLEDFPDSYCLNSFREIELSDVTIKVPSEIYLYNLGVEKSSELEVEIFLEGNENRVRSIGWVSSDPSRVEVTSLGGKRARLSAVSKKYEGKLPVNLVVSLVNDDKSTETKEIALDVFVEGASYIDEELWDVRGNKLYLDPEGEQRAHISDYIATSIFYGDVATTGWQVISGKKYYFDYNSLPVTGRQIIGGLPYEFDQDGVLASVDLQMGIDVSKWQKDINWEQVAKSGVTFAIIRCGYRGALTGKLAEDEYFRKNVEGATANGIKVGVYFFTQAITEEEAIEEAKMTIRMCKNYAIDLPLYIDSENAVRGRANSLGKKDRTKCLAAFCETVEKAGYVGGVYASKCWFYDKVNASELEKYNIWVAQYNTECNYKGKTDFWQYSSKETIDGIVGYVDVDVVRINP